MILQKLQEMEERNGTREDGEERKEEPDPEQQDENITLSRSGSEKSSKSRSQSPEPYDCRLPLLNSVQRIQMMGYRVEVTLNPKTANPQLVLSNDRRSVRLGDERKDLLNCHERFDTAPCVLANEGFSFGRYYWEVDVWGADCWAVGVARKSVKRKGHLRLTPEHGIWTIEMHMGKYWALNTSLALVYCNERLHRVGIYLNYTEGQVAFYNAESLAHLYTFTTSFTEEIFPFFYTKDKMTPLVINRSEIEGWIPLTEQTQPSPAPII
ncbi:E3 ubiquitin-protein ligase TRIM7-like [Pangshura tecta]